MERGRCLELNDLWPKKICRPMMIVWSGATFILRWSCFIRGSSVFMLNRNMIFQGFPCSHLQLIEGFRVGLILHSLFPPHFSITAHHFDFPILQQNSFLHPSIIRWYLNCLSCWADIFPTSIFHLLGPPSSLSSQQSIQKVPFLTKSWREGKLDDFFVSCCFGPVWLVVDASKPEEKQRLAAWSDASLPNQPLDKEAAYNHLLW